MENKNLPAEHLVHERLRLLLEAQKTLAEGLHYDSKGREITKNAYENLGRAFKETIKSEADCLSMLK